MNAGTSSKLADAAGATSETRLLRIFLAVSLGVHMLIFTLNYIGFSPSRPPLDTEWNIDTDLVADYEAKGPAAVSALPRSEPNLVAAVPDTMLPQLPKQFALKEPLKAEDGLPDPEQPPAPSPTPSLDIGKSEAKDKTDIRTLEPQRDDVNKIEARDALMRSALERLRKEAKPETKKNQAPEQNEMARIAAALADSKVLNSNSTGSDGIAVQRYEKVVYAAVKRHYVLPTTYKQSQAKLAVTIAVVINARGDLVSAKVEEESGDSAFDQLTLTAAQEAGPFPRPPASLTGTKIYLKFTP